MPSSSPKLQSVPASAVTAKLEAFSRLMQQAKTADGGIDLVKARELVGGNPVMVRMLELVRDNYAPFQTLKLSISSRDTERVFTQLTLAKQTVGTFDVNDDGKIQWNEEPTNYESGLHRDLVGTLLVPGRTEKGRGVWFASPLMFSKEARLAAEAEIDRLARHHAKTPAGQEALRWHMRKGLAEQEYFPGNNYEKVFRAHESDWLGQLLPFLNGDPSKKKGHLSDKEVQGVVRSKDLQAFVAEAKKLVNTHLMMDYESDYLAGRGLATADAVNDPIFGVKPWTPEVDDGGGS